MDIKMRTATDVEGEQIFISSMFNIGFDIGYKNIITDWMMNDLHIMLSLLLDLLKDDSLQSSVLVLKVPQVDK